MPRSTTSSTSSSIEIAIVSLVILVFLWHIPSAIVPIVTIPVSVLLAFIPMSLMGISVEHHVARRHRHLHRRPGGRRHRGGGERVPEAREVGARGPAGRLPCGAARGPARGGALGLLLAAGDRGRVPPHLHPRRPGGAPVHTAGLDQEPHPLHRRTPGHHPRSRPAHALHPDGLRFLPSALALPGSSIRPRSAGITRRRSTRSAARSSRSTSPRAASCSGIRSRRSSRPSSSC